MTNTTPIGAYRGAGRPEATALVERAMDMFAAKLDMDPAEVRRKNFIPPDEFPRPDGDRAPTTTRASTSGAGQGAGERRLRRAARRAGRAPRPRRPSSSSARPGTYVEWTGFGSELGTCEVDEDGTVTVSPRAPRSHGQGHETAYAQLVPTRSASRWTTSGSSSPTPSWSRAAWARWARARCRSAAARVQTRPTRCSTRPSSSPRTLLEAAAERHRGRARQGPRRRRARRTRASRGPSWPRRRPTSTACPRASTRPRRERRLRDAGRDVPVRRARLGRRGGHRDRATRAAAPHHGRRLGRILNPMLAEGQVHGGIAQGVAQALFEQIAFDEDGNNVTGSLVATRSRRRATCRATRPSARRRRARNPLGAKGIGESGAIGSTPAVWNAVVDACRTWASRTSTCPRSPQRVWQAIEDAKTSNGAAAVATPLHRFPGVLRDAHPGARMQFQPVRSVL